MKNAEVSGLKELDDALGELDKAVAKRHVLNALKKVGEPIKEYMQATANTYPGVPHEMADSITVATKLNKRQRKGRTKEGLAEIFIGPSGSPSSIAHLFEYGTSVIPVQSFIRSSWDATKGQALDTLKTELWASLERAAKRAAAKARRLMAAGG